MSRHAIRPAVAPAPPGAASPGVATGHYVFVAGQLPYDVRGEITAATTSAQAERALDNLAQLLLSSGLSLDDVVSLEIQLVDESDQAATHAVIATRFAPPYPALTLCGVPWLPGGARVQIAAVVQRY